MAKMIPSRELVQLRIRAYRGVGFGLRKTDFTLFTVLDAPIFTSEGVRDIGYLDRIHPFEQVFKNAKACMLNLSDSK